MRRTLVGGFSGGAVSRVSGRVPMPASKSHTVRGLLIASFAEGTSRLIRPLPGGDALSCRAAVEVLGAQVRDEGGDWLVRGGGGGRLVGAAGGARSPLAGVPCVDVGNSGTTLYLAAAMAALMGRAVRFDGDNQIRRRSAGPLLGALRDLGASAESAGEEGCAPFTVAGPISPGRVRVECPVSQYLSGLLLAAPLIPANPAEPGGGITEITVLGLNEAPYVGITLDWLDFQNIRYEKRGWERFGIPAGQSYSSFERVVPADWSSAAFFMAAAAISGGELTLEGLDTGDSQGDKAVLGMLERMGCRRQVVNGGIRITGARLKGAVLDLNDTPDALPVMAVTACFAEGKTRLENVPQARMKETDRIAVMTAELRKLGADVHELPEGMLIRGRRAKPGSAALRGARVEGHGDHRVVMALAAAALGCEGNVVIEGAEVSEITFPGFFDLLEKVRG